MPTTWISIEGNYYSFNKEKKTQSDARAACCFAGGKLYEPKYEKKYDNVSAKAKFQGLKKIWLGIREGSKKGEFMYQSDNSPLVDWLSKINQGRSKMSCVLGRLSYKNRNLPRWFYGTCDAKYHYVCEKNGDGKTKTVT